MSNVSLVTKYFPTANEGFIATITSGIAATAAIVPLSTVAGLTNGSIFVGIIDPGDAVKQQVFTGTVDTAGLRITGVVWTRGTDVAHAINATVVDYTTGTDLNMITTGILKQHNQDGTHGAITATSLATTAAITAGNGLTVSAGSVNVPAAAIKSAAFGLSSGNTGGVTTTTGGGTGSFYYINMGGIKMLWGTLTAVATGGTGTVTFPVSFFTTIQSASVTAGPVSGTGSVHAVIQSGSSLTTTSLVVALNASSGAGTMPVQVFVIGT